MATPTTVPDIQTTEQTEEESWVGTENNLGGEVIVHNCECHTYQQVIELFCKVIPGMNPQKAFELAWQIDHQGSAIVFSGKRDLADWIGTQLAIGGLRVEVR